MSSPANARSGPEPMSPSGAGGGASRGGEGGVGASRGGGRANRGPAAAAENRSAILAAAQRLFARDGFLVPLNAIAREAGVSQGVLYRHFHGRMDLADAVFEGNLLALEEAAASTAPGAFADLWRQLLRVTVSAAAFVELVLESRHGALGSRGSERFADLIDAALRRARECGEVDAGVGTEDVLLAWRMAFGIVTTAVTPEQARADLAAARLLGIEL